MGGYGSWVTNCFGNRPKELIKSHSFIFWCQMWDVTLKWTTYISSTGFGEAIIWGSTDLFYGYGIKTCRPTALAN